MKEKKEHIELFEKMKAHIGQQVFFRYTWYAREAADKNILRAVTPYTGVSVGGLWLPFVGNGCALLDMYDTDGNVLYQNLNIDETYDVRNDFKVYDHIAAQFGKNIANEHLVNIIKWRHNYAADKIKHREWALSMKTKLMEEPLVHIIPEKHEEWKKYADNNTNEGYDCAVVEQSAIGLRLLSQNKSCKTIDKTCGKDLTGYQMGCVARDLSYFSPKGDRFRKYWNGLFTKEKVDGVINPALMTLKKKKKG